MVRKMDGSEPGRTRATFAQKVLARASGLAQVVVGQIVDVRPDIVLSHDNTAAIRTIWLEFGQQYVSIPERLAITLDHAVPAPTTKHAQNHAEIRQFVREQGIGYFWEVGRGICHQVLSEEAVVLPGNVILGADSHTTHFGWMGAFGAGIGRSEVAVLWATGELWLRVPESIRVVVEGILPLGVTAKDFALRLIGDLGVDGGLYACIEFSGSAIEGLTLDSRMVLPNMMAEFGAKSAYIAPDAETVHYLATRRATREMAQRAIDDVTYDARVEELTAEISAAVLEPDSGADYVAEYTYDAAELEPYVACPSSVDNVVPVSQLRGQAIQQAFIGTCTNGRLEDLAAAAAVLQGQQVAAGTRLLIVPASRKVLQDAVRLGYVEAFLEAGAAIGVPGCGPCMGNHMGVPGPDEVTISSANRNFKGRMGTATAPIFLASPAVVAASAIAGEICDPRRLC